MHLKDSGRVKLVCPYHAQKELGQNPPDMHKATSINPMPEGSWT
jgi:hypothetical protein